MSFVTCSGWSQGYSTDFKVLVFFHDEDKDGFWSHQSVSRRRWLQRFHKCIQKERRYMSSPQSLYFLFFITKHIPTSMFPKFHCDQFPSETQPLLKKRTADFPARAATNSQTHWHHVSVLLPEASHRPRCSLEDWATAQRNVLKTKRTTN